MIESITRYLSHLYAHYALAVSVHFRAERLSALPHDIFLALLPYNSHRNRYCMEVKKGCSERCLASQREIYEGDACPRPRICHAGVKEKPLAMSVLSPMKPPKQMANTEVDWDASGPA